MVRRLLVLTLAFYWLGLAWVGGTTDECALPHSLELIDCRCRGKHGVILQRDRSLKVSVLFLDVGGCRRIYARVGLSLTLTSR